MQTSRRPTTLYILIFLALAGALGASPILPAPVAPAWARDTSALPLPRFVSLRSSKINLRSGPGMNFPIQWVYQRKHLPVEIIAEYDTWRKIRDWQGTVGWVHQSMLDGGRYAMITGSERIMHQDPSDSSPPTAHLMPGVVPELLKCEGAWCRLKIEGYKGWLKREEFYGVYPSEKVE